MKPIEQVVAELIAERPGDFWWETAVDTVLGELEAYGVKELIGLSPEMRANLEYTYEGYLKLNLKTGTGF